MNSKKILKIIIINIIVFFVVVFILNFFAFMYFKKLDYYKDTKFSLIRHQFDYSIWADSWYGKNSPFHFREPLGTQYKKPGITLFGCSYMYGSPLPVEKTFAYKLSQTTHRPVYNLATPGSSTQHALLEIESGRFDNIIKKSDYAIYMPIGEHGWRIKTFSNGYPLEYVWPRYVNKNGKLVFYKPIFPIIEASYLNKYITKKFWTSLAYSDNKIIIDKMFNLMILHIQTMDKELKAINPNIKLVILIYPDDDDMIGPLDYKRWKTLENDGIIVLDSRKLVNSDSSISIDIGEKEYRVPVDFHPNEKAWNLLTPKVVQELNL